MSKAFPPRPRALSGKSDFSYAIVASKFNETYVQALVDHAHTELNVLDPEGQVVLVWTPGSFEIPLFVQATAELKRFDAILALGVILQGGTDHARLVAETVTKALLDISLAHRVPVIHEVLFLQNEEQAKERCLGDQHNRGAEAARAAVFASRKLSEIA
jgi:6,7-dimethyl-8-ribityllumazine synthase